LDGVGVCFFGLSEFPPGRFRAAAVAENLLFCLLAQEHGTGNGPDLPDAAGLTEIYAPSGSVRLFKLLKESFEFFLGREQKGDDLVGKEGKDAFEAAAGAQLALIAGGPAKSRKKLFLKMIQGPAEPKIGLQSFLQFFPFTMEQTTAGFVDGSKAVPLVALVFAHTVQIHAGLHAPSAHHGYGYGISRTNIPRQGLLE
jgi:hypothetical protein